MRKMPEAGIPVASASGRFASLQFNPIELGRDAEFKVALRLFRITAVGIEQAEPDFIFYLYG